MQHIIIEPDLSVTVEPDARGLCIQVAKHAFPMLIDDGEPSPELSIALSSILPPFEEMTFAELARQRPMNAISVADPWLVAVAYIMWEGALQGMAWDAIKILVDNAISRMQADGVAPNQPGERESATGLRFRCSSQLKIANLIDLKGELEIKYNSMSEEKRRAVPRPKKR